MINQENKYVIDNYGKKSVFSNFLPGISGKMGIPLWCFYVNRGQAIASFGIADKDHSIMQFYPAHQSYQNTKRLGFRTFIKVEDTIYEGFSEENNSHAMAIGMNDLEISEVHDKGEFSIQVKYITLPEEKVAGLVRMVTIENKADDRREFEIVDGMAAILPYGLTLAAMTEMGQTSKAWMQVEQLESGCPIFKLRASMEDSAQIKEINGGNFGFAVDENGNEIAPIVSNEILFGYDTSLTTPIQWKEKKLDLLLQQKQNIQNDVPSCYFGSKVILGEGETYTFFEIFGQTEKIEFLDGLRKRAKKHTFFTEKFLLAEDLTIDITNKIATKTKNKLFDLYCRQTYLDNVLRGGEPIVIGDDKVFYLYSRKHGDIERDYNYFRLLPEFYSQGNGNFRDINQNRRCDVRFSPYVKKENILLFYKAIQIDGYNPLGIEKMTYYLDIKKAEKYLNMKEFLVKEFTPGSLINVLMDRHCEDLFYSIMSDAISVGKTDFIEGYWSDHWTYNLDLVEEYLSIYPDQENELLFQDINYSYTIGKEFIIPARRRYVETEHGIRQYHFLEQNKEYVCDCLLKNETGEIILQSLIEKMILICVLKTAALDPYSMGVEMEGGKPGWYDALNGLPGLLGSSMAETYELERLLEFVIGSLKKQDQKIEIALELNQLLNKIVESATCFLNNEELETMDFYHKRVEALEFYRENVKYKLTGEKQLYDTPVLEEKLVILLAVVQRGIKQAMAEKKESGNGICPTYFYYTVMTYQKTESGIKILTVKQEQVPDFLEGSVRFLKTKLENSEKKELYYKIRKSNLYDNVLKMYKVNADLDQASYEIGRAKAFTKGWLENESIWLHMEYKYLLELLKSDMQEEYLEDFKNVVVPFLEEKVYGRSLLENSSFIASSSNPDSNIHGKGFVARLSGSTVEFIHMWQIMMFGKKPFQLGINGLELKFSPLIPDFLIGTDHIVEATFLGTIKVIYMLPDENTISKIDAKVESYQLLYADGSSELIHDSSLNCKKAEQVRQGNVVEIQVKIKRI